jgi:serine/threonine protein kinase/tetratricopeptide (TPR) repeat protein
LTRDASTDDHGEVDTAAVQKLFWETLAHPETLRLAWLDEQDTDPVIAAEVRELLNHHSTVDTGILATPPVSRPASAGEDTQAEASTKLPESIGPFRIVRIIASGGMGTVYEAEQERPRRTVALKVMNWGARSESTRRRFEFEAEALARLRHHGIAQLYAAVLPEDLGSEVPYIVMEYVPKARSITSFARAKRLPRRDLLELFAAVCDAVHHGHQRGVIHRDLKPANILVNTEGNPKIIDFGVARLNDRDSLRVGGHTQAGQMVGTMSAMSPEQVLADPDDIDTRSDVYALGVVLYELLSLRPPYEVSGLSVHEATEIITKQEPGRLGSFDKRLSGDLEIITAKALAKDRDQRYVSASALADDIRRFLGGLPITARRPSLAYHVVRFTQRNRILVSASAIVVLALVAATLISIDFGITAHDAETQAQSAKREAVKERDIAEAERQAATEAEDKARRAELRAVELLEVAEQARAFSDQTAEQLLQISEFYLEEVLAPADRSHHGGKDWTIREAVDAAVAKIENVKNAEVRATLFAGFGNVYMTLSDMAAAVVVLEQAVALRRELHDQPAQAFVNALQLLAIAEQGIGHEERAMALYMEALEDTLTIEGPESDRAASLLQNIANLEHSVGNTLDALDRVEEARAILIRNHAPDDPLVQDVQLTYFGLLRFVETSIDVISELNSMLDEARRREQPDLPFEAELLKLTGSFLLIQGSYVEALDALTEVERIRRIVLEPRHVHLASTLASKGICLLQLGQTDQAVECITESVDIYTERYGPEHPSTLEASLSLGVALTGAWRLDEAAVVLRRVWDGRIAIDDKDGLTALRARVNLGTVLARLNRFDEAEQVLLGVWQVLEERKFTHQPVQINVAGRLIELYQAWNRPEEVDRWTLEL